MTDFHPPFIQPSSSQKQAFKAVTSWVGNTGYSSAEEWLFNKEDFNLLAIKGCPSSYQIRLPASKSCCVSPHRDLLPHWVFPAKWITKDTKNRNHIHNISGSYSLHVWCCRHLVPSAKLSSVEKAKVPPRYLHRYLRSFGSELLRKFLHLWKTNVHHSSKKCLLWLNKIANDNLTCRVHDGLLCRAHKLTGHSSSS